MGKIVAGMRPIDEQEFVNRLGEFMISNSIHPEEIISHHPFRYFLDEPQQYKPEGIYGWNPGDLYLDWTVKHFTGLHLSLAKKKITFRDCPTGAFEMRTRAIHAHEDMSQWVNKANQTIARWNSSPRPIFPRFPVEAYYDIYKSEEMFIDNFAKKLKPFHHEGMSLYHHFIEMDGVHSLWSAYLSYENFDFLIGRQAVMRMSSVDVTGLLIDLLDHILGLTYNWNKGG